MDICVASVPEGREAGRVRGQQRGIFRGLALHDRVGACQMTSTMLRYRMERAASHHRRQGPPTSLPDSVRPPSPLFSTHHHPHHHP